jgi:hypothetical protein
MRTFGRQAIGSGGSRLEPFRKFYRGITIVSAGQADGTADVRRFGPHDGVLTRPITAMTAIHVMMEVGKRAKQPLHFIAAWQIFRCIAASTASCCNAWARLHRPRPPPSDPAGRELLTRNESFTFRRRSLPPQRPADAVT